MSAGVIEPDAAAARHVRWADLPAEPLKDGLPRRLVTGERMMIAHVYFKKGDYVAAKRAFEFSKLSTADEDLKRSIPLWLDQIDSAVKPSRQNVS